MRGIVISWKGQHQSALGIYRALCETIPDCRIIWSDPGDAIPFPDDVAHLRRPDDLFWGDKFHAAIASGDPDDLLFAHADCQCGNWISLVQKCRDACGQNKQIAVWAPLVLGTSMPLVRTAIEDVDPPGLKRVAQTDGLVFALRRDIVERMLELDYSKNLYGWGIDWMFNAVAGARGSYAAVDPSVLVRHKVGQGYPEEPAAKQMQQFLTQMTPQETKAYTRLSKHLLRLGGRVI